MKVVMICGAGLSRAEGSAFKSKPHAIPPLDTDFFRIAASIKSPAITSHLETVNKFFKDTRNIDLVGKDIGYRMENAFNDVYFDAISRTEPLFQSAFLSLIMAFRIVIANTTNSLTCRRNSPLYEFINSLIKNESDKLTIVSFNQDILIEKALDRLAKSRKDSSLWNMDYGYGTKNLIFTAPTGTSKFQLFPRVGSKFGKTRIVVLKPHGSLNWYAVTVKRSPTVKSLFAKKRRIYCSKNKRISEANLTYSSPKEKGRQTWYTWPLIVPPVFAKLSFAETFLKPIWEKIDKAIKECERLIIVGYSFPIADYYASSFLRRATYQNRNLKQAIIINPDLDVSSRCWEVISVDSVLQYRGIKEYLEELNK